MLSNLLDKKMQDTYMMSKVLGINRNQSTIYLNLIKCGKATVAQLSKMSGISRTTIYGNLMVLINNNLVSQTEEQGKKYYIAESPEMLKEYAQNKVKEITDLMNFVLPMYNSQSTKPSIKIYNPDQTFVLQHELSLMGNVGRRTRMIGEVKTLFSYKGKDYIKEYVKKRIKLGIRNEVITNSSIKEHLDMYSKQKNGESLREIRFNSNLNDLGTQIFSYDESVWILPTKKQGYGLLITNKEFADTFNSIFNALWCCSTSIE